MRPERESCYWPLTCACPDCRARKSAEAAEAAAAAAPSLSAAVAAEEAPANDRYNNIMNDAPFLRDLAKPKHFRFDWEEVHPALALSSGGSVLDAPRLSGRLRPSPVTLRLRTFIESEAFANARSVVFWVSLGAAMLFLSYKAFGVL